MKKSRFTEEQIIGILKQQEAGRTTAEVCREAGISSATFYAWKAKFGGMNVSEAQRLRQLEAENAKLRRVVADQAVDRGSRMCWQKNGEARARATYNNSMACLSAVRLLWWQVRPRCCATRASAPLMPIIERLRALAEQRPRWGYRRLHVRARRFCSQPRRPTDLPQAASAAKKRRKEPKGKRPRPCPRDCGLRTLSTTLWPVAAPFARST